MNFEPESLQRSYPFSPDGLERTRIGGSLLVPALSGQSQTDKVTVSWADNKFLRYFLASCRAERERESRLRFMVVLQLDPMAFIISLEIPRMFGDDI